MELPVWYNEYCSKKNNELLNEIEGKVVIFLDTKLWIKLRDYSQGKPIEPIIDELYSVLKERVSSKKCICPLIESVYFELLKRTDQKDVIDVFRVVDELANDLMQVNIGQIAEFEVLNFINNVNARLYVNKIQSQYIRFPILYSDESKDDEKKINIDMIECFLNTKLEELFKIKKVNVSFYEDNLIMPAYCLLNNSINSKDKRKYKSYKQLKKHELKSTLETLYLLYRDKYNITDDFVENAINCKELNSFMPFVNNTAALYANIRWSELNNLTTNDIYDLINFPCALGYSDIFLAETKHVNRLKQKPLSEETKTKTIIESDARNVIDRIKELT